MKHVYSYCFVQISWTLSSCNDDKSHREGKRTFLYVDRKLGLVTRNLWLVPIVFSCVTNVCRLGSTFLFFSKNINLFLLFYINRLIVPLGWCNVTHNILLSTTPLSFLFLHPFKSFLTIFFLFNTQTRKNKEYTFTQTPLCRDSTFDINKDKRIKVGEKYCRLVQLTRLRSTDWVRHRRIFLLLERKKNNSDIKRKRVGKKDRFKIKNDILLIVWRGFIKIAAR